MAGQISLKDWMSDAEYEWRQKLKPVNLVIETDFNAEGHGEDQEDWGVAARALRKRGVHTTRSSRGIQR